MTLESDLSVRRTRRTLVALLLIAALGALALAALGASAERGTMVVVEGETAEEPPFDEPEPEEYTEPDWAEPEMPQEEPKTGGDGAAMTALLIAGGILVALVLVWLALRMRALARPPRKEAEESSEEELSTADARTALSRARRQLDLTVDAQDAVVNAWLALEEAIARADITRAASQTTFEFVVSVLGSLALDRTALDRLAHLYRRALFDDDPLDEQDRRDALAQLDVLTRQLEEHSRGEPSR